MSDEQLRPGSARRRQMRAAYRRAFQDLNHILSTEDPMSIAFEDNPDEYELEVGTILPRLRECRDVEDVRRVVDEEFERWFGEGEAGRVEQWEGIAQRIWNEVVPRLRPSPGDE